MHRESTGQDNSGWNGESSPEEERYRFLAENSTDMISRHTQEGVFLYASPASYRLLGYEPEELIGRSSYEMFHPEDLGQIHTMHERVLELPEVYTATYRIRCKDGSYTWFETSSRTICDPESGEVREILSSSRDISERKRIEEELRLNERRYRFLYEDNPSMYFTVDWEGTVLSVNRFGADQLGYSREELRGHPVFDIFHPDDRECVRQRLAEYLSSARQDTARWEARKVRKDGGVMWVEEMARTVQGIDGDPVVLIVCDDITERKQAQEALLEIRGAERRRIARDLHDTVLQDLVSALQMLQATRLESFSGGNGSDNSANLGEEISALRRAVEGLRGAIYNLRLEKEQSFVRAVESLVELNRQRTPERETWLTVGEGFPEKLPPVASEELLRIIREALVNARRHSGARQVAVFLDLEDDRVRVRISDDGRGFKAESREGVGLAGMRERAAALGGELHVLSSPDKGTEVTVEVPVEAPAPTSG